MVVDYDGKSHPLAAPRQSQPAAGARTRGCWQSFRWTGTWAHGWILVRGVLDGMCLTFYGPLFFYLSIWDLVRGIWFGKPRQKQPTELGSLHPWCVGYPKHESCRNMFFLFNVLAPLVGMFGLQGKKSYYDVATKPPPHILRFAHLR